MITQDTITAAVTGSTDAHAALVARLCEIADPAAMERLLSAVLQAQHVESVTDVVRHLHEIDAEIADSVDDAFL